MNLSPFKKIPILNWKLNAKQKRLEEHVHERQVFRVRGLG
jgi:hypothetical protein